MSLTRYRIGYQFPGSWKIHVDVDSGLAHELFHESSSPLICGDFVGEPTCDTWHVKVNFKLLWIAGDFFGDCRYDSEKHTNFNVYSKDFLVFFQIPSLKLTVRTWKCMVGRRSFPFVFRPIFRAFAVSFRVPGIWFPSSFGKQQKKWPVRQAKQVHVEVKDGRVGMVDGVYRWGFNPRNRGFNPRNLGR